jgi:hypothetical protein
MKEQEMNEFLQSIGGLQNGYYTDREPIIDSGFFECDSGWYQILKDLIADLIALGWDKQICQVKEKYGGLRFYINSGSDEIHNRIIEAERLSHDTCEITGHPGKTRRDLGWHVTLCDEEYEKRLLKRIKKRS